MEQVAELLLSAAKDDLHGALQLDDAAMAWLRRVRFVSHHRPDLGLPHFDDADLFSVVRDVVVGCKSFKDIRARGIFEHLKSRLDWQVQQEVDRLAPVSIRLPTGSLRRLQYGSAEEAPVLAARIQQLFGMSETPRVLGGRLPVLLHLLAPNQRPAQVTSDLASFWANTWPEVRRDLRGRYPKHAWPDDPLTAEPEDRPQRRRNNR